MNPDPAEIAKLIAGTFIERRDAKAIQTKSGAYMPVRTNMKETSSELVPWSLRDVIAHVEGEKTYGHYLVTPAGTCRCIVFDCDLRAKADPNRGEEPIMFNGEEIDPRDAWSRPNSPIKRDLALQLRTVAEGFARRSMVLTGLKTMVSYSGAKGMHAYVCLEPGTSAHDAREMISVIIESFEGDFVPAKGKNFFRHAFANPAVSIEVFPKQEEVSADGFGNLVRLPLGVNQKSGKPGFFLVMGTDQKDFKIDDPLLALKEGSFRD